MNVYPPGSVESRTYWKVLNGDPFDGGAFGHDSTWATNGQVHGTQNTSPTGAVAITKVEHDALEATYLTEWANRAVGGQAWLDAQIVSEQTLKDAARTKLIGGLPLTGDEAAIVSGGNP